jgi:HTH-type transcriptional regulator/antitoxin HigA
MTTRTTKSTPAPDRYLQWIHEFPLRPIRSDAGLDAALGVIDRLLDRKRLFPDEHDYLDVLSTLVQRYESGKHPLPAVSEAAMLRHLVDSRKVAQAEVARATGIAESTISAVLAGARRLNREHIEKLAKYFHVGPAAFFPR